MSIVAYVHTYPSPLGAGVVEGSAAAVTVTSTLAEMVPSSATARREAAAGSDWAAMAFTVTVMVVLPTALAVTRPV